MAMTKCKECGQSFDKKGTGVCPHCGAKIRHAAEKQHYVWAHYLKAWATDNTIYCLRDGKIITPNPEKIARETEFYKLTELTPEEIAYLERFVSGQHELLRSINLRWIRLFVKLFAVRRAQIEQGAPVEEIARRFEPLIAGLYEKFHGKLETWAVDYFASLRKGDASFFNNPEIRANFLYFVSLQYTRTNNARSRLTSFSSPFDGVSAGNMFHIMSQIMATSIGHKMFVEDRQM
jgi:hypothetical protein